MQSSLFLVPVEPVSSVLLSSSLTGTVPGARPGFPLLIRGIRKLFLFLPWVLSEPGGPGADAGPENARYNG